MDLRSVKPGRRAALVAGTGIFHPTLTHPLTGEPLEAVGVVGDSILWPIIGGAEDDDSAGGGDDDAGEDDVDDDSSEEDDSEGDENEGDDDEGDGKKSKAQKKIDALEEEKDRHYRRRRKAEKELAAAKEEIERLKASSAKAGKKKSKPAEDDADEDEVDDEEKTTLRAELEKQKAANRQHKIQLAFLRTNTVDWHNPAQVMTLLMSDDDYEVEFDDRGNVDRKSLSAELKRFAKANPHLVKPKVKSNDTNDDDQDKGQGSSGSSMNGTRKGKTKQAPTREDLARKYPALGAR